MDCHTQKGERVNVKVFVLSDEGIPSGYGRIATEINRRLVKRGVDIFSASVMYDGKLPAQYDGERLPYWVGVARPVVPGTFYDLDGVVNMINAYQPDIIHVIQDFPYAEGLRNVGLDWSKFGFLITTPVDGAPLYPAWVDTAKKADALITISQFGVDAWRKQGVQAKLARPAANLDTFYRLPDERRAAIRAKLGIEPGAFVWGMVAMNQGRKAIPQTLKAFFSFAEDKPTARLLLDMDAQSPAGWDIPAVCQQQGWSAGKLIFKSDCIQRGVTGLNERYNAMDFHSVISYREGFGLPLVESMACGVLTAAQDYSSGTEVVGGGRGVLIPSVDYFQVSTWGGAMDKLPDYEALARLAQHYHDHKEEAAAVAKRGMEWARGYTWDAAADTVFNTLHEIADRRKPAPAPVASIAPVQPAHTAVTPQPDGVAREIELVEKVS